MADSMTAAAVENPPLSLESQDSVSILVVDDSRVVCTIVEKLIAEAIECEVRTAANGKMALAACREQLPTVVVTDIHMPEMDGFELVTELKESYPSVPVILMTGQGSEEQALQALRAGAANYVPKKDLQNELVDTLERVIQAARVDRRKQRLLGSLRRRESQFALDNDATLVAQMVTLLQEELFGMGLCTAAERIRIGVALEEALLNALYHGNLGVSSELRRDDETAFYSLVAKRRAETPYRDRRVHVTSRFSPNEAVFVIRDEGDGFDISKLPDPQDAANLDKPSGRGILLIRTFMDDVAYNAQGNEVTMTKRSKRRQTAN